MQPKPPPNNLVIPSDIITDESGRVISKDLTNKRAAERKEKEIKRFKARRGKVMKKFKAWVKRDDAKRYAAFDPIGPLVLIRLFLYEPDEEQDKPKLLTSFDDDGTGAQKLQTEMFPYAKVLRVGSHMPEHHADLEENDIVLIQDTMCGVEPNNEWIEWKMITTEKPSIASEWPQPPRYVPSLGNWGKYIFKRDKFMPGNMTEDAYTFLVPPSMIRARVNVDEIR